MRRLRDRDQPPVRHDPMARERVTVLDRRGRDVEMRNDDVRASNAVETAGDLDADAVSAPLAQHGRQQVCGGKESAVLLEEKHDDSWRPHAGTLVAGRSEIKRATLFAGSRDWSTPVPSWSAV